MDPDEVNRHLALLLKAKDRKRRNQNYFRGRSSSSVPSNSLNQAMALMNLRERTTSLPRTQTDCQQNVIQRRKRKQSRF